jgi:hypothetical protein
VIEETMPNLTPQHSAAPWIAFAIDNSGRRARVNVQTWFFARQDGAALLGVSNLGAVGATLLERGETDVEALARGLAAERALRLS